MRVERRKKSSIIEQQLFQNETLVNVKEITNNFGETLTRVDGNIPVGLYVKEGQRFLFISYDQSRYTHGLHKYPAKFFPELPRWLIKRYSKEGDIILDPFTGSATTNIEALLNKRHSVGIDVDPFTRFLAKVKTTPLKKEEVDYGIESLLSQITTYKPSQVHNDDLPDFPFRDNWFNNEILFELSFIRKVINNIDVNEDVKDFYKICLSSIIRAVSNADNNCTRTVVRKKLKKQIYPSMALTKFVEAILINSHRINNFSKICPKNVSVEFPDNEDARFMSYKNNYFDLAITSPPYVNAVDYPRTHQLEIYWLGFANGSLTPLKRMHVGTESVKADDYKELKSINLKDADLKLKKICKKDKRRAFIAYKYLKDMELNLKEIYRTLKPGAKYIPVVGNNNIRGEIFENWKYIMQLGEKSGFKINTYFGSEIINHFIKVPREERINNDWILVLEK